MDKAKLLEAIAFARENHLSAIEVEGVKMTLADLPQDLTPFDEKPVPQPEDPWANLTDDEIMFWSSPYYEEIQEKKDAARRAREETEDTRGS